MKEFPSKFRRKSIRLPFHDYSSPGTYFVTLCTQQKECFFGELIDGKMHLNEYGEIVQDSWLWIARQYEYVRLDEWIIMPNHLHGIIIICEADQRNALLFNRRGGSRTAPTPTEKAKHKPLGRLIGAFKTISTKLINLQRNMPGVMVWQRNFYEHIIRKKSELDSIRQYIRQNTDKWLLDPENPHYSG